MSDFFSIFQPGMQYVREQRDFEKVRFVEAAEGEPGGPSPVDFDAGTITIHVPPKEPSEAESREVPDAPAESPEGTA